MEATLTAETELIQALKSERVPNALLFSGPVNSGRKKAAFWFVKGCNCLEPRSDRSACDKCRACSKINAKTHPDILVIQVADDKKQITITQVRQIQNAVATRPNEARYRMVLIEDAHLMTVQAQNALLKILEEPPERTFFTLVTHQAGLLVPTIHSRCRTLVFRPVTDTIGLTRLTTDHDIDPLLAGIALATADNDISTAMQYLGAAEDQEKNHWINIRQWLIQQTFAVIKSRLTDPAAAVRDSLAVSWRVSLDPVLVPDLLAILKTLIRDLIVFEHAPKKIVNLDFFSQFEDIKGQQSRKVLSRWADVLLETEKKLTANCSLKLALDCFFINLVITENRIDD